MTASLEEQMYKEIRDLRNSNATLTKAWYAARDERDEAQLLLDKTLNQDAMAALRRAEAAEARVTELEAAYETVVKERDSWRILAEGWKLTNDVELQGCNQSK